MDGQAKHPKGNVKIGEGSQSFLQVRLHHGLGAQSGEVFEGVVPNHGAIVWVGSVDGELGFKGLDHADDGAVLVAQGDGPGATGMRWPER